MSDTRPFEWSFELISLKHKFEAKTVINLNFTKPLKNQVLLNRYKFKFYKIVINSNFTKPLKFKFFKMAKFLNKIAPYTINNLNLNTILNKKE